MNRRVEHESGLYKNTGASYIRLYLGLQNTRASEHEGIRTRGHQQLRWHQQHAARGITHLTGNAYHCTSPYHWEHISLGITGNTSPWESLGTHITGNHWEHRITGNTSPWEHRPMGTHLPGNTSPMGTQTTGNTDPGT